MSDAGSPAPEAKPRVDPVHINIKVKDQHENEVYFKIKKTTKLSKVFEAYCDRQSIERKNVRFLLDGSRVQDEDTPGGLEMEEGDMLEVVLEQLGGDASLDPSSHIQFSIRDSNEVDVFSKIKRNRKFSKTFIKYCEIHSLPRDHLRFFFDGRLVHDDDTPRGIKLSDGDVLDATNPQLPSSENKVEERSNCVTVRVEDSNGDPAYYSISNNQELGRIMDFYNASPSVDRSETRFTFEGQRICANDTAEDLGMTDGEVVFVWSEQRGGAGTPEPEGEPNGQKAESGVKVMLNIRVRDQESNEVHFKIKSTTPMRKVMEAYCHRHGVDVDSRRFCFDGRRILKDHTPESLDMEDEDCLDVFVEQRGGANDKQAGENISAEAIVKPEVEARTLKIKVKNSQHNETIFILRSTTKLGKMMEKYAKQQGRTADTLRYLLSDGKRIEKNETPESLNMEDGEVVDVHEEQHGGWTSLESKTSPRLDK